MEKRWRIYIVAHTKVFDWMYQNDKFFNNENYHILNVGNRKELINGEKYNCIHQYDLENAVKLGKWWAESEGIYNIWKSSIYKELNYIGFIHYDKELRLIKRHIISRNNTNISERISKYLKRNTEAHISLETHDLKKDYGQNILADVSQPNTLVKEGGVNCWNYILNDYNKFFNTNYTIEEYLQNKSVNLCSCFLIDCKHFEEMMGFWDWIVQSGKLNVFDTEHKNRLQGGLAERYFGIYFIYAYDKFLDLSLVHHGNKGLK